MGLPPVKFSRPPRRDQIGTHRKPKDTTPPAEDRETRRPTTATSGAPGRLRTAHTASPPDLSARTLRNTYDIPESRETYSSLDDALAAIDRVLDRECVLRITARAAGTVINKRRVCSKSVKITFPFGVDSRGEAYQITYTLIVAPGERVYENNSYRVRIERHSGVNSYDGTPWKMDSAWLD